MQNFIFYSDALVSVYTQERRNHTALYATGLPAISEFTIHMWYYGDTDGKQLTAWVRAMIRIATQGRENVQ